MKTSITSLKTCRRESIKLNDHIKSKVTFFTKKTVGKCMEYIGEG